MMRIGITAPVVTRFPGAHGTWETKAGITELAQIASAADHLGFHHFTCSEHVAVPVEIAVARGGTYWDPLATLGFLAARTERIRLATQVLVLGYHHPLEIAKRYGTLDVVSSGRLILGLGVGSLQEEFELLAVPFADRGKRADDALAALRAAISTAEPQYSGDFFEFSDVVLDPHAMQSHVPFWIGGRSARSLSRAVELADGWVPFGLSVEELVHLLGTKDLPSGFEVVLSVGGLDPIGDADRCRRHIDQSNEAGATVIGASIIASSANHYCDQLDVLARMYDLTAAHEG